MDTHALATVVTPGMDLCVLMLMSAQAIITVTQIHGAKIHLARLSASAIEDIREMGENVMILMNALNQMHAQRMLLVQMNRVIIHVPVTRAFCQAAWFAEKAANVKILTSARNFQATVMRMLHVPTLMAVSHVAVTLITKAMV